MSFEKDLYKKINGENQIYKLALLDDEQEALDSLDFISDEYDLADIIVLSSFQSVKKKAINKITGEHLKELLKGYFSIKADVDEAQSIVYGSIAKSLETIR